MARPVPVDPVKLIFLCVWHVSEIDGSLQMANPNAPDLHVGRQQSARLASSRNNVDDSRRESSLVSKLRKKNSLYTSCKSIP